MKRLRRFGSIAGLFALLPALAHAHPGHDGHDFTWDFQDGLLHPLTGWDHLAAMIAVGVWAAQLGGRARWIVPSAFVIAMNLGAVLSRSFVALPGLEQGIAASVLVLGLVIALAVRLPTAVCAVIVAGFAVFHGFAHGLETSASVDRLIYALGFVASTVALHVAGFALGVGSQHFRPTLPRFAGWAIAASGIVLLAQ